MLSEDSKKTELFLKVLNAFQENGVLEHLVLIGSWTHYFYSQYFNEEESIPSIRTVDIDFLVPNSRKKMERVSIPKLLGELEFEEELSWPDGYARYVHRKLVVEFLAPLRGSGTVRQFSVKELGINVQALRYMDILCTYTMEVEFQGKRLKIPRPESYVLHKALINKDRRNPMKKEKDAAAIVKLGDLLLTKTDCREQLRSIYKTFTPKWKKRVLEFSEKQYPSLKVFLEESD